MRTLATLAATFATMAALAIASGLASSPAALTAVLR